MYFVSKCWRGTKLAVASTQTVVCGGVLLHGLLAASSGGTLNIALGAIGLAGSALLFFDSSKVQADILSAIKQNERTLTQFKSENSEFKAQNGKLSKSIMQMQVSLRASGMHIKALETVQKDYVASLDAFQKDLAEEKTQTEHLTAQVDKLDAMRARFVKENEQLQASLQDAKQHSGDIKALYETAVASDSAHCEQIKRLETIVDSMQQLLPAVAHEGDQFQAFSDAIDTRLLEMDRQNNTLENTASTMERLLSELTREKFVSLDKNNDGVVTRDEFC